jgi:CheY-like chemotaxis protein
MGKPYPNETAAAPKPGAKRRGSPVVLIVDDDFDARFMYRRYLIGMGCTVHTARNGFIGVARAKSRKPDVIVMDLAMPRLDGFGATTALRSAPVTREIPIIALSALPFSRTEARAAGCDGFLAKPCLPELLWCQIKLFLHGADPHASDSQHGREAET